jgi:hypothetical protein
MDWLRSILQGIAQVRRPSFWHRRVCLQRSPDGVERPPPMHWVACHPTTMNRFKATVTCPSGHLMTLRAHRVKADGIVSPSVVCPASECGFHEYVQLKDWPFPALN